MLTFEMIRELERREKENKKLQKIPENLVEEIREYIKRKEKNSDKTSADILELENVKNTIRRFFEMREKKIADMALITARTGMLPDGLTKEEEKLFYQIVGLFKDYREFFFCEINKEPEKVEKEISEKREEEKPLFKVKKEIKEFIGPDMKKYRLIKGEVVNIPKPLNDLLLKEGIIEEIKEHSL